MKIKILKTTEIDENTWQQITVGFNESFDRKKTAAQFKEYYSNTVLGYAFHALAYTDEGDLAGSTSIIPHQYSVAGAIELFGLSGGTYVKKEFRSDIFIFQDMSEALRVYCSAEGLKVFYGVSNKNSFKYAIHFLKVTHLMDLDYYALPVKAGKLTKSKLAPFINSFSYFFSALSALLNIIASRVINSKASDQPVHIIFNEKFSEIRFAKGYTVVKTGKFYFAYKIINEEGVATAYIMEYRENGKRTYRALSKSIGGIMFKETVDLILYIGTIHHKQSCLFKVPQKYAPKRLPLTYETLGDCDGTFKKIVSKKDNWEFGLINFDVR